MQRTPLAVYNIARRRTLKNHEARMRAAEGRYSREVAMLTATVQEELGVILRSYRDATQHCLDHHESATSTAEPPDHS